MTSLSTRRATLRSGLMAATAALALTALAPAFATPAHAQLQGSARAQNPGFADVVDRVKGAVVSVQVQRAGEPPRDETGIAPGRGLPDLPPDHPLNRFFREFQERRSERPAPRGGEQPRRAVSQGSGFFISADGFVVTNHHVIAGGNAFTVVMDDGQRLVARLVGSDDRTDLALLKVDRQQPFPFVGFSRGAPRVGEWVVAIGNPFGLGGTVTAGIVSARGRDIGAGPYDDFLQIDAPVNRGNSGGPSFNLDGEVIGINTAIYSPSGGSVGIGFAIPAATAEAVIAQLRAGGSVTRGWLGVQIQPVTDEIARSLGLAATAGVLIADPQAGGPAARAGIRAGDVVLALDGRPVRDARELVRRVADLAPGSTARLDIVRAGDRRTIPVEIGRQPERTAAAAPAPGGAQPPRPTNVPTLGLAVAPTREGGQGLVIVRVDPDGRAAERGLRRGDVITEVGGEPVATAGDLQRLMEDARGAGRNSVLARVRTGERSRFVAIPLANRG